MKYLIKNIDSYTDLDYLNIYNRIKVQKRRQIDKIKRISDKKRSLLGEYCLIQLLKDEYNLDYEDVSILKNGNGKPYINDKNIYFSISHSNDYVVVAVSNNEIGVDIERIKATDLKTIKQFANDDEREFILSSKEETHKRLFEIYTLKEAYIKMKGTNMTDFKKINFRIEGNEIICSDSSVKVLLFDTLIERYIISICEKV